MANTTTIKGLVISQYGSVLSFTEAYRGKYGKISYTAMRKRLENPDGMTIGTTKKMLSLLDLSDLSNPYGFLLSNKN